MTPTTSTRFPTKRVSSADLAPDHPERLLDRGAAPLVATLSAVVPDPEPAGTEPGTADRGGAAAPPSSRSLTRARVSVSPVAAPCS